MDSFFSTTSSDFWKSLSQTSISITLSSFTGGFKHLIVTFYEMGGVFFVFSCSWNVIINGTLKMAALRLFHCQENELNFYLTSKSKYN